MSNVVPVYPSGIFTWTDKVDLQDADLAENINSVASDLISVENTLGTNPEIESQMPVGNPKTYSNVSNRISDAMNNNNLPVCTIAVAQFYVNNSSSGSRNAYQIALDPFNMFNGTDLTIPANGWYILSSFQRWDWWNDGFSHHYKTLNGQSNIIDEDVVDWTFAGNVVQGTNNPGLLPRWQIFGKRPICTKTWWQGALHEGDRISVYSENGTSNAAHHVSNSLLKACMVRSLEGTFTSG